jgi:GTP-binding protein
MPPVIAIVGRPNVGKSTLFNRLIGRRRAIVGDEPGITRDRLYGDAEWLGQPLRVIDTGGIIPDEKELIPAAIYDQAKVALDEASAIVLVVDARTELAAPDMELAQLLRRTGKPLFLAVNKVDTPKMESAASEFHRLGIPNICPLSAENGTGVGELLDAILQMLPHESPNAEDGNAEGSEQANAVADQEVKIAIIGRPNVGKSTLLNALTGTGRAIVSPIPGTTRDAVDQLVERDGLRLRFIDTAGIRRKGKTKLMAEKLSVVMARKHLETADIALLVIDATEGVTALDANVAGYAHESGRSVIIVINKWDLVGPAAKLSANARVQHRTAGGRALSAAASDRNLFEQQVRHALKFLDYAPILFVSALDANNTAKIFPQLELVARERRKRIPTGEMNRFLRAIDFERASVPASRRVKIYYLTQVATGPPTFILFTDRKVKLHFAYERFLQNQIRRTFGFVGTPIWIKTRASE